MKLKKGIKFDSWKLRWTLFPFHILEEILKALMCGSCKYEDNNWMRMEGLRERCKDSLQRHVADYLKGEVQDYDGGKGDMLHVLAHAAWCCIFIMWIDIKEQVFVPFTPNYQAITEKYDQEKVLKNLVK